MKKILLVLFGLLCIGLFMLIPDRPGTAYPIPTPQVPEISCTSANGIEHFRVDFASCSNVYLWYRNRPSFHAYDEIFVYAESIVPYDGWSILSPTEFITWTNNGELFYTDLDHNFMSGKLWYVKGHVRDNETNQLLCESENAIIVDCTGTVPKSKIKLPMIFKAVWWNP